METSFWNQVVYRAGHQHTTDTAKQSSICLEIALVWTNYVCSLQGPSHRRRCPASQEHSFVRTAWFQHNSTAIESNAIVQLNSINSYLQIFTVIFKVLYHSHLEIFFPTNGSWIEASPPNWTCSRLWPVHLASSCRRLLHLTFGTVPARFVVRKRLQRWPPAEKLHLLITHNPWQFVAETMETPRRFCNFDPKVKKEDTSVLHRVTPSSTATPLKGRYGVFLPLQSHESHFNQFTVQLAKGRKRTQGLQTLSLVVKH